MFHLDKLDSFRALVFELFSSKARQLVFKPRGCEFEPHPTLIFVLAFSVVNDCCHFRAADDWAIARTLLHYFLILNLLVSPTEVLIITSTCSVGHHDIFR